MLKKITSGRQASNAEADIHVAERGRTLDASEVAKNVVGFDSDLMQGRTLLTREEERKLIRRVDLHLMPLLALILMVKNIDANNVGQRASNCCHWAVSVDEYRS